MSMIYCVPDTGVSLTVYDNSSVVDTFSQVKQQLHTVSYAQGRSISLTRQGDFSPECWCVAPQSSEEMVSQKVARLEKLSHGCVQSIDIPRGFQPADVGITRMGVTQFNLPDDANTLFTSAISMRPLAADEAAELSDLLTRHCGPLVRMELSRVGGLVETLGPTSVGDNQFTAEAGDFGTPEAPRFFMLKADVVNLSGRRALLIEGSFVSANWTPGSLPPKANFAGAFFVTPDGGVQSISLQGSPDREDEPDSSSFQSHYYKFVRSLKTLQWRAGEELVQAPQQPCLILRIGEPVPAGPNEIRWVS